MTTLQKLTNDVNELKEKLKNKMLGSAAQRSVWRTLKRKKQYVIDKINEYNKTHNITTTT